MMSKVDDIGGNDKYVVCPFFKWADHHRIGCEGVAEGNTVSLVFGDPDKKALYRDTYCRCMEKYTSCRIYQMLARKYVDDGQ